MDGPITLCPAARRLVASARQQSAIEYLALSKSASKAVIDAGRAAPTAEPMPDRLREQVAITNARIVVAPHSDLAVRKYVVRKSVSKTLPCVIFLHGGGWVWGNSANNDALCARIAHSVPARVLSVEYSLAPERPFPAAIEDAWNTLQYCYAHATALKIDRTKIVLAGASAGGNLAAVTAMRSRDRGGPPIALQVLVYPVLDPEMTSGSYQRYASGFMLTADQMKWFWREYLGEDWSAFRETDVSPLLSTDHTRLPPLLIFAAACDPLRDEAAQYATLAREANNRVEFVEVPGQVHGFVTLDPNGADAEDVALTISSAIRRATQ